MPRAQNLPDLPVVACFEVAPHRYLYTGLVGGEALTDPTYRQVKEAAPYKAGDVVYVAYGDGFTKAYIHYVGCRRDRYDDKVEYYDARRETKKGDWAKKTYMIYPGTIQRGYHRAGLAPEIPEGVM